MATNPYRCKCLYCKHEWLKRSDNRPKLCPGCKTRGWDRKPLTHQEVGRLGAAARWPKKSG